LSTGDFQDALRGLLGENASGLSSSNITRLVSTFSDEREAWQKRSLEDSDYVYIWVDGIHFNVRIGDERVAILVVIGAKVDGTKEVIALEDGYRESKESWLFLLRNLRDRGMKAPNVAVGDGALGFWAALPEVFPSTLEQRCWVHKIVNVLDKLPKSMQARAKAKLHEVVNAPTRQEANKAMDTFQSTYGDKYPKATKCLLDSRNQLLVFFDFPAAHWKHLRTTNPIESTFATVRLRTRVTKGPGSRSAGLAMVYKLLETAAKTWRKLSSPELLPLVRNGVAFEDGVRVERTAAPANTKPTLTKVRKKKKDDYAEKAAA
jgi:transposase-like protein